MRGLARGQSANLYLKKREDLLPAKFFQSSNCFVKIIGKIFRSNQPGEINMRAGKPPPVFPLTLKGFPKLRYRSIYVIQQKKTFSSMVMS